MLHHIQVLEKDLAVNAMDACARFGVDAAITTAVSHLRDAAKDRRAASSLIGLR